eukprot:gene12421-15619_t
MHTANAEERARDVQGVAVNGAAAGAGNTAPAADSAGAVGMWMVLLIMKMVQLPNGTVLRAMWEALPPRLANPDPPTPRARGSFPLSLFPPSLETTLAKADEGRTKAVKGRAKADEGRTKAEKGRAKAEEGRAKAEEGRTKAEKERAKAEEGRTKAEKGRAKAEEGRAKAEEGRTKAEKQRAKAEEGRTKAEKGRAKAEEGRTKAEKQRAKAEEGRTKAEKGRAKAEEGRTKAEKGRDQKSNSATAKMAIGVWCYPSSVTSEHTTPLSSHPEAAREGFLFLGYFLIWGWRCMSYSSHGAIHLRRALVGLSVSYLVLLLAVQLFYAGGLLDHLTGIAPMVLDLAGLLPHAQATDLLLALLPPLVLLLLVNRPEASLPQHPLYQPTRHSTLTQDGPSYPRVPSQSVWRPPDQTAHPSSPPMGVGAQGIPPSAALSFMACCLAWPCTASLPYMGVMAWGLYTISCGRRVSAGRGCATVLQAYTGVYICLIYLFQIHLLHDLGLFKSLGSLLGLYTVSLPSPLPTTLPQLVHLIGLHALFLSLGVIRSAHSRVDAVDRAVQSSAVDREVQGSAVDGAGQSSAVDGAAGAAEPEGVGMGENSPPVTLCLRPGSVLPCNAQANTGGRSAAAAGPPPPTYPLAAGAASAVGGLAAKHHARLALVTVPDIVQSLGLIVFDPPPSTWLPVAFMLLAILPAAFLSHFSIASAPAAPPATPPHCTAPHGPLRPSYMWGSSGWGFGVSVLGKMLAPTSWLLLSIAKVDAMHSVYLVALLVAFVLPVGAKRAVAPDHVTSFLLRCYASLHLGIMYLALCCQLPGLELLDLPGWMQLMKWLGVWDLNLLRDCAPVLLVLVMTTFHAAPSDWVAPASGGARGAGSPTTTELPTTGGRAAQRDSTGGVEPTPRRLRAKPPGSNRGPAELRVPLLSFELDAEPLAGLPGVPVQDADPMVSLPDAPVQDADPMVSLPDAPVQEAEPLAALSLAPVQDAGSFPPPPPGQSASTALNSFIAAVGHLLIATVGLALILCPPVSPPGLLAALYLVLLSWLALRPASWTPPSASLCSTVAAWEGMCLLPLAFCLLCCVDVVLQYACVLILNIDPALLSEAVISCLLNLMGEPPSSSQSLLLLHLLRPTLLLGAFSTYQVSSVKILAPLGSTSGVPEPPHAPWAAIDHLALLCIRAVLMHADKAIALLAFTCALLEPGALGRVPDSHLLLPHGPCPDLLSALQSLLEWMGLLPRVTPPPAAPDDDTKLAPLVEVVGIKFALLLVVATKATVERLLRSQQCWVDVGDTTPTIYTNHQHRHHYHPHAHTTTTSSPALLQPFLAEASSIPAPTPTPLHIPMPATMQPSPILEQGPKPTPTTLPLPLPLPPLMPPSLIIKRGSTPTPPPPPMPQPTPLPQPMSMPSPTPLPQPTPLPPPMPPPMPASDPLFSSFSLILSRGLLPALDLLAVALSQRDTCLFLLLLSSFLLANAASLLCMMLAIVGMALPKGDHDSWLFHTWRRTVTPTLGLLLLHHYAAWSGGWSLLLNPLGSCMQDDDDYASPPLYHPHGGALGFSGGGGGGSHAESDAWKQWLGQENVYVSGLWALFLGFISVVLQLQSVTQREESLGVGDSDVETPLLSPGPDSPYPSPRPTSIAPSPRPTSIALSEVMRPLDMRKRKQWNALDWLKFMSIKHSMDILLVCVLVACSIQRDIVHAVMQIYIKHYMYISSVCVLVACSTQRDIVHADLNMPLGKI